MSTDQPYKPDDLLTKMEVCQLFMEEMRISQDYYYKKFRPFIKFKAYAGEGSLMRIPYRIAIGLINYLKDSPKKGDPPLQELNDFRKKRRERI